jgi:hypothetical protein
MSYTLNTQPTRPVEQLRTTPYAEMNSAEITKLSQEDPAAYQAMVTALDTPAPVVLAEGAESVPVPSGKRTIFKNGVEVENSVATRFVNGIPVIQQ